MPIRPARSAEDFAAATGLFKAYAAMLGVDLGFQDFAAELAGLPGAYAPPGGELLLALDGAVVLGCVGVRPIAPEGCCEMKRLFVAPEGRGHGVGRALVDAILSVAAGIGYREMRLDTIPALASAIALYRRAGFKEIAPYYATPLPGTIFMARTLEG